MRSLTLMVTGLFLSAAPLLAAEDSIEQILSGFTRIETMAHQNPQQAGLELKRMQTIYGMTNEFTIFSDRYDSLKKEIYQKIEDQSKPEQKPSQVEKIQATHHRFNDVKTLEDLFGLLQKGTLVLLDIDDTVLIKSMINHQVEPIEKNITEIIQKMRDLGGIVFGLSIRSLETSNRAIEDLNSIQINYGKLAPKTIQNGPFFDGNPAVGYKDGIIFAAAHYFNEKGGRKGPILVEFLKKNPQLQVPNILFADDSEDNVDNVDQALKQEGISSAVFHFVGGQNRNVEITKQAEYVKFDMAPLKMEENEMRQYNLQSVEELRTYKSQAAQLQMNFDDYMAMLQ